MAERGGGRGVQDRAGTRAWIVLAAALGSALVLLGAAATSSADPAVAGEATLARLAGGVADGVVGEWERLRADPEPFRAAARGEKLLRWSRTPPAEPARAAALDLPRKPDPVLDALLGEANRRAAEGALDEALEILRAALARPADPARRAELLLRTIQLAVAHDGQDDGHDDGHDDDGHDEDGHDEDQLAHATWLQARDELDPGRALDGTSALLLATLAAARTLDLEERAGARDRLSLLWSRGELPLPVEPLPSDAASLRAALREPAPRRAELRRRLQALLPEGAEDARLARTAEVERAQAFAQVFGALEPPTDEHASCARSASAELLFRRASPNELEGLLLAPGALEQRLRTALSEHRLLPPDFGLDLLGTRAELGPVVREATPLEGSPLAFVLRHADPERVRSAVGRRQAWMRAALCLLALLTATAGISTFRALRRAERLAALRSAFVASVSHELRTPIASILLLAENLERGRVAGAPAQQRYHALIRREAERLRGLVEDVLDVARLERGEQRNATLVALDPAALASALEAAARERVAEAGGTLEFSAAGLPARLLGDPEALRRALLNLIENALRHSGSRDLDLALAGDGVGGLVIRVRDHGRGVPAADRARIFEPFERLERPDAAPGTGLGLAIVREVATRHGGVARVLAPEEGQGAVFEIHLPRAREGENEA